ncbi:type II toxin-antitoxin system RelE/ParE family toxin [soil metagenome]
MSYAVLLTAGAERDLEAIYDYIADTDGEASAERVPQRLLELTERLAELPERGAYPRELLALGIREYRQVLFKPFRVIYRVSGKRVIITLIADGRREMQALLARRLLGSE